MTNIDYIQLFNIFKIGFNNYNIFKTKINSLPVLVKCNQYFDDEDNNLFQINNSNCSYSQLSNHIKNAVITSEDNKFFNHHGFNIISILRALKKNIINKKYVEGGSSITQQLVKNLTNNNKRNLLRKVKELLLAIYLESNFNKDQIFEAYLASSYFGRSYIGICEAAYGYFGKSVNDLSLSESAWLASILPSPNNLNKKNCNKLKNSVLHKLLKLKKLIKKILKKP